MSSSRLFNAASSQILTANTAPISEADITFPVTMAGWAYFTDLSTYRCIMGLGKSDSTHPHIGIWGRSGPTLWAVQFDGTGAHSEAIGGTPTLNKWEHVTGVFRSSSSRSVYLNGVIKDTDAGALGATDIDNCAIGGWDRNGSPAYEMEGMVAHAALWNCELSAAEIWQLGNGLRPDQLRGRLSNLLVYKTLDNGRINNPGDYGGLFTDVNGSIAGPANGLRVRPYQTTRTIVMAPAAPSGVFPTIIGGGIVA